MAKRHWAGEDAVGKRFKIGPASGDGAWLTVVGVFKDVRQSGLDNEPGPWFMRPYTQAGWPGMSIVTRTASAPASFVGPVRSALATIEPNQPASSVVRTMEEIVGLSISGRRFPMLLLSGFGVLALVLAAIGISGVVGYSVVRRTQEIGLRMALGAQRRDVLRLILGQSLAWTLGGVVLGLAAAFGLLRFLDTLLYGISAARPWCARCGLRDPDRGGAGRELRAREAGHAHRRGPRAPRGLSAQRVWRRRSGANR